MSDTIRKYYLWLIKNFANVELTGCHDMAVLLAVYDSSKLLKDNLEEASAQCGKSSVAIEKSCRFYIKKIMEDYTLEDISKFFDYRFKNSIKDSLNLAEFIPIVKIYLEQLDETE